MHELVEVESGRKNNTDKDNSQRRIELLQILAEGCRKHPAYRAKGLLPKDAQNVWWCGKLGAT